MNKKVSEYMCSCRQEDFYSNSYSQWALELPLNAKFTYTISFSPHSNPMREPLSYLFTDEETELQ